MVLNQARKIAPDIRTLTLPGGRAADRVASARALREATHGRRVIYHANGLSALNLVGGPARLDRSPVLVHFHAFKLRGRESAIAGTWLKLGVRARFHGVSDFARGLLEATALRSAVGPVLPNPFDAAAFAVGREPSEGPLRIGFVGGSDPRKGLRRLIEMVGMCADLDVEWRIFGVASDRFDPYLEDCRAFAARLGVAERLSWLGAPSDPRKLYGSVDVVVIASELESFCRVAVEAMMAGLPSWPRGSPASPRWSGMASRDCFSTRPIRPAARRTCDVWPRTGRCATDWARRRWTRGCASTSRRSDPGSSVCTRR